MPRNPIKMLTLGCGAATFAGLFGLSLASYAESGSFEFYKQRPYYSAEFAQSAPVAEIAGYSISPPRAAETIPVPIIAAPRAQYSPGYPGNSWPRETRVATQVAAYEPIERDDDLDRRMIPETGGSWSEPARERSVTRAEGEDAGSVETVAEDGDPGEGPPVGTD